MPIAYPSKRMIDHDCNTAAQQAGYPVGEENDADPSALEQGTGRDLTVPALSGRDAAPAGLTGRALVLWRATVQQAHWQIRQIQLNVDVTLGYSPLTKGVAGKDIWPVRAFQETIFVQRESWLRLLTQAPTGTSLAVVVPVPLDGGGAAKVGTLLREAIDKVNKGEYGDAVTAARRAVDAMGGGWASEKSILSVDKAQRSLDQRLSLLRHALHRPGEPVCAQ